jgi:long-subunit acyl-CoA synthetase (AMP-forming)
MSALNSWRDPIASAVPTSRQTSGVEGPNGAILGVGQVGELCFRSPQVVHGYWNNEEATNSSFREGWFHSGDIGYIDEGSTRKQWVSECARSSSCVRDAP